MIFVTVGSQIYQFDRLIKAIDMLMEEKIVKDKVIAQIGSTNYLPKNYEYKRFMNIQEYNQCIDDAEIIISHGGVGALIGASKKGKTIIAVPRIEKLGEHCDNHQLQIVKMLEKKGYVYAVYNIDDLKSVLESAIKQPIHKVYSEKSYIVSLIDNFIAKE